MTIPESPLTPKPLRLLFIIDSLAPGGAEVSLAELAAALTRRGQEVHVAWFGERFDLKERFVAAGAILWHVPAPSRLRRIRRVRRLCKDLRPDIVHTTLFEADVAGRIGARLAHVPVTSSLVNEMYGQRQLDAGLSRWRILGARLLDMTTLRLTCGVHAISATIAETMGERLRLDRGKVTMIPRGRDHELLGIRSAERRAAARGRLGVSDDRRLLVAVARHETQKGLDTLIAAMPSVQAACPDAQLLIAGREGNATRQLHDLVAALGSEPAVRFLGARGDVADLMVAADALAFPSRWEGFGGTLLEAMALECPIVCSDLPVVREVVGSSTGAQFAPVDDPGALAERLIEVLTSARPEEALAANRRRSIEHFSIDACAHQMENFYRQLLDQPTRSGLSGIERLEPRVVAIAVTFNRCGVLFEMLRSIDSQTRQPDHIIVIDNASPDDTVAQLNAKRPEIEVIRMPANLGPGGAIAAGLRRAIERGFDLAWLVEDDTTYSQTYLKQALDILKGRPTLGMLGARGFRFSRGALYPLRLDIDVDDTANPLLDGAVLRLDVAATHGTPVEDFFTMMTDIEYPIRLRDAGIHVAVSRLLTTAPLALGATDNTQWKFRAYYQTRNHLVLALRRRSPLMFLFFVYRTGHQILGTIRHRDHRATNIYRLRGVRDGLRGRMGRTLMPQHPSALSTPPVHPE